MRQRWKNHRLVRRFGKALQPWLDFWTKLNEDWVFNLSGLLAYNFLMSLFPILLILLAAVGFMLGDQAPEAMAQIERAFTRVVPGGAEIFQAVSNQLTTNAGLLLLIGVIMSAFAGSHLFIVIENCFGIIFRARGRGMVRQQLMAFGMLGLYLILVPIIALASAIPTAIIALVDPLLAETGQTVLPTVLGTIAKSLSAFVLFSAIYIVVPNRRIRLSQVGPGALLATVLLIPYVSLFPLYASLFLQPGNSATVAGFAVVILVFFYYLGFILLLGAEVNSWIGGQRLIGGDLPTILQAARTQADERTGADAGTTDAGV
jgi:membrane protein